MSMKIEIRAQNEKGTNYIKCINALLITMLSFYIIKEYFHHFTTEKYDNV